MVVRWGELDPTLGPWRWPASALLAGGAWAGWRSMAGWLNRWSAGRGGEGLGAVLRGAFYALVGSWLLSFLLITPFDRRAMVVVFTCAGAACLLIHKISRRMHGPRAAKTLRAVDLVLLNLCVLVVGAEVGLRSLAHLRPSVLLMRSSSEVVENIERARYAPGTVRHGYPVNSGGHYDQEFVAKQPERALVVAVGDSFSAGVVHHSLHFTTVAERALPDVDVYNMGVPSIAPPEYHHLVVAEALPLNPDLVVINLFVGNDLYYPLPPGEEGGLLRGLCDRDNVLVYLVPSRLATLAREGRDLTQQLEGRPGDGSQSVVPGNSQAIAAAFPWVDDPSLEIPKLKEQTFLKIERSCFERLRVQPKQEYEKRLAPLSEIRDAAGKTPVVVMLIPDVFQVEDGLWRKIKSPTSSQRDRMRALWIAKEWLRRKGIPYLNLLPVLHQVQPMEDGDRHLYHAFDTHFNARGNRVVGEALADFIRQNLPES